MSSKALVWAWKIRIPNASDAEAARYSQKLTLLALAEVANHETWEAFFALETATVMTELAERVIRRALADLERHGIIKRTGRTRGRTGRLPVYELLRLSNPVAESGFTSEPSETDRSGMVPETNPDGAAGFNPVPATGSPDEVIRTLRHGNPDSASKPPTPPNKEVPKAEPRALNQELAAAPRPERALDPLIEILCVEAEGAPEGSRSMPASRVRTVAVAASKIRPLGATPEDVHLAVVNWPTHFRDATITAPAIAEHWARLQRPGRFSLAGVPEHRGRHTAADEDWSDITSGVGS